MAADGSFDAFGMLFLEYLNGLPYLPVYDSVSFLLRVADGQGQGELRVVAWTRDDPTKNDSANVMNPYQIGPGDHYIRLTGTNIRIVTLNSDIQLSSVSQIRVGADQFIPEQVPEPSSMMLLSLGLAGLGFLRKRV